MSKSYHGERREYPGQALTEENASADPFKQFKRWMSEAIEAELVDATAMTLATVSAQGQPSARTVLLKEHSPGGFVFFGHYQSKKGQELTGQKKAALLFYWREFSRQVRIEGKVEKIAASESDEYFRSRPRQSQIAAAISEQSQPVADRASLERAFNQLKDDLADAPVPRPAQWGGFSLKPQLFEFWQGRENRLHDRLEYLADDTGSWQRRRLAP